MASFTPRIAALVFGMATGAMLATPAQAVLLVWDGGAGNNDFSSNNNWTTNNQPSNGDDVDFDGNVRLKPFNDLTNLNLRSLFFRAGADAFTVSGNDLTITTSGNTVGLSNDSNALQTLDMGNIALGNAQTWAQTTAGGSLLIKSEVSTGGNTFTFDAATGSSSTIEGRVRGSGSVFKTGGGELVLGGNNAFSGGMAVLDGTLSVSADQNLGDGSGTATPGTLTLNGGTLRTTADMATTRITSLLAAGGTFRTDAGTTFTHNGEIDASGALTKTGEGTLTLGGPNSFGGGVILNEGTLRVTADSHLGDPSGALLFGGGILNTGASFTTARDTTVGLAGGSIDTDASTTLTHSGLIQGSGLLTKDGGGTLVLSSANTHLGGMLIKNGTVAIASDANLGDAAAGISFDGGTLNTTTDLTTGRAISLADGGGTLRVDPGTTLTYNGVASGSGALTKAGDGLLLLKGNNNYLGDTRVDGGTLRIGAAQRIDDASSLVVAAGATFDLNGFNETVGSLAGGGAVTLGSADLRAGANDGSTTFAGVIDGSGDLIKQGIGVLQLDGENLSTGNTIIQQGTLRLGASQRIGNSSTVAVHDGAVLDLSGFTETLKTVSGSGQVELGDGTLVLVNGANNTLDVRISGSGGLTKGTGNGILTLNNANTYTGTTRINDGRLRLGNNQRIANESAVVIAGGATFDLDGFNETVGSLAGAGDVRLGTGTDNGTLTIGANHTDTSFAGAIEGAGNVTKVGNGTLTLTGINTYAGPTRVSNGTLRLGRNNAINSTSSMTVLAGAVLDLDGFNAGVGFLAGAGEIQLGSGRLLSTGVNPTNFNFSGTISGTGRFVREGDGTLTLSGVNTYSGGTTIRDGGTISVARDANLGDATSTLTLSGGILRTTADMRTTRTTVVNVDSSDPTGFLVNGGTTLTHDGNISGDGGLRKTGNGTLVLGGNNTYTRSTRINQGIVDVSANANLGAASTEVVFDGGTLRISQDMTTSRKMQLLGDGGTLNIVDGVTLTHNGVISDGFGAHPFTKNGEGMLVLRGKNTFDSDTRILAGTLRIGSANERINNASNVSVSAGARFDLNGFTETIAKLSGDGDVLLGAGTLSTGASSGSVFSGVISGTGNLVKRGSGALTLGGDNSYSGATDILNGTLRLGASERINDLSALTVNTGGTFDLDGFDETVGSLAGAGTVSLDGGTLNVGGDDTSTTFGGIISGTGTLIKAGNGTLALNADSQPTLRDGRVDARVTDGVLRIENSTNDDFETVRNAARLEIDQAQVEFAGTVTNDGIFVSNNSSVTFNAGFVNNGTLITDPNQMRFDDWTNTDPAATVAAAGDEFIVTGDLLGDTANATGWDTDEAILRFEAGVDDAHLMQLYGIEQGGDLTAMVDNFAWGTLALDAGQTLSLADVKADGLQGALYLDTLLLSDFAIDIGDGVLDAIAGNGFNIYYNPFATGNGYLSARSYTLAGGGQLLALSDGSVTNTAPEPGTMLLLAGSVLALSATRRRRSVGSRSAGSPARTFGQGDGV